MNRWVKILLIVLMIGSDFLMMGGKTATAEEMATDEGLEITGLVMDESKTKMGRDFFDVFNTHWQEIKGLNYTITISELPDGGRGSFIMVWVNDSRVFFKRMNPRMEWIEEEAKRAVRAVQVYLLQKLTLERQLEEEFQY